MWRILTLWLLCISSVWAEPDTFLLLAALEDRNTAATLAAFKVWSMEWETLDKATQQYALVKLDKALQRDTSSLGLGLRGQLYFRNKRLLEAAILTRQAVFAAQASNDTALLIRWHWQAGRIFNAQFEQSATANTAADTLDAAIRSYQQAIAHLLPEGASFQWEDVSCRGANKPLDYEKIRSLFIDLADLLLQRAKTNAQTKQADLMALVHALEKLKLADIQHYFGACQFFPNINIEPKWPQKSHSAVIYPILATRHPTVLVKIVGQDKIHAFPLPADRQIQIENAAQQLHSVLRERKETYQKPASQLYQSLLAPLQETLSQHDVDTLAFVPEGALYKVPWAVLWDGTQFLVENYAITTLPALSLLPENSQTVASPRELTTLAAGLTVPVRGYPALPFAETELELVQTHFPQTKLLQDQYFNRHTLQQQLENQYFDNVHIVSHAHFEDDFKQSFLETFDEQLEDKAFIQAFIDSGNPPLQLLVLSACSTAEGDKSWAALGLAGMTWKAGVRSLLATLWEADDATTYGLIEQFYANSNLSKAKALQAAQRLTIEYQYPPYKWAALVLIGDW